METNDDNALRAQLDASDEHEVYGALIAIGQRDLRQCEPSVAGFLDSTSPELRSAAIRVLAFYWGLPAYRALAHELARAEPDPDARSVAIMAWASYARETGAMDVLRELAGILLQTDDDRVVRVAAYQGLMSVAGVTADLRSRPLMEGPLEDALDWDLLRRILDGSGVELPDRRTTQLVALGVHRVRYQVGEPHNPVDTSGQLTLTLSGEAGLARLVQLRGSQQREWIADMPPATWANLVTTMHRLGFPRQPAMPAVVPPGTAVTTLGWSRGGEVETVMLVGAMADYRDVNRLIFAMIAQIEIAVLGGELADWSQPGAELGPAAEVTPPT